MKYAPPITVPSCSLKASMVLPVTPLQHTGGVALPAGPLRGKSAAIADAIPKKRHREVDQERHDQLALHPVRHGLPASSSTSMCTAHGATHKPSH